MVITGAAVNIAAPVTITSCACRLYLFKYRNFPPGFPAGMNPEACQ